MNSSGRLPLHSPPQPQATEPHLTGRERRGEECSPPGCPMPQSDTGHRAPRSTPPPCERQAEVWGGGDLVAATIFAPFLSTLGTWPWDTFPAASSCLVRGEVRRARVSQACRGPGGSAGRGPAERAANRDACGPGMSWGQGTRSEPRTPVPTQLQSGLLMHQTLGMWGCGRGRHWGSVLLSLDGVGRGRRGDSCGVASVRLSQAPTWGLSAGSWACPVSGGSLPLPD